MRASIGWLRERWFAYGLLFFAIGALTSTVLVGAAPLPQIRTIGLMALGQALVGVFVCAAGLRVLQPARWQAMIAGPRATRDAFHTHGRQLRQR
jgi:hypothetical protein